MVRDPSTDGTLSPDRTANETCYLRKHKPYTSRFHGTVPETMKNCHFLNVAPGTGSRKTTLHTASELACTSHFSSRQSGTRTDPAVLSASCFTSHRRLSVSQRGALDGLTRHKPYTGTAHPKDLLPTSTRGTKKFRNRDLRTFIFETPTSRPCPLQPPPA